jgi:hypothetical protein
MGAAGDLARACSLCAAVASARGGGGAGAVIGDGVGGLRRAGAGGAALPAALSRERLSTSFPGVSNKDSRSADFFARGMAWIGTIVFAGLGDPRDTYSPAR